MKNRKFTFSVITPIYNAEEYLEEAIESVLDQTIGFRDNVQIILVNDGSKDNSDTICRRYKEAYPDNIVYIEKENGGVSSARNEALKHIRGRYVVFLDADDKWEKSSFRNIAKFFNRHYEEIDVCSCKMTYIGDFARKKHPLDYKFSNGNRVVSLVDEPRFICTTLGNTVFKSESLARRSFDESMKYCEDSWFLNPIIAEKLTLGIVSNAIFYYRKNDAGNNASMNIVRQHAWYFDVPEQYYLRLFTYMKDKFGYVPQVFQETIFYDIKWRGYNADVMETFSDEQKEKHIDLLKQVLKDVDDDVILNVTGINTFKKIYFLNIKHGRDLINGADIVSGVVMYNDCRLLNLKASQMLIVKTFSLENDIITITGLLRFSCIDRPYTFYVRESNRNEKIYPEIVTDPKWGIKGIVGEQIVEGDRFRVAIPVKPGSVVSFYVDIDGEPIRVKPKCGPKTGFRSGFDNSFCVVGDRLIRLSNGRMKVFRRSIIKEIESDARYLRSVRRKDGFKRARHIFLGRLEEGRNLHAPLKNRVAFISIRSEDELLDNMERVYTMLELPKVVFAKKKLGDRWQAIKDAKRIISTSRIVVTDDYLFLMKNKKKGQKYVQLWHATGAGKYFGQDGTNMFLEEDAQYHRNYDLVTVSSEYVRDVYRSAFNISKDKILATGVARTDAFFDNEYIEEVRKSVYEKHPEFINKKIILYTPTFRDIPGRGRAIFIPELDFERLSKALPEDQLFIVRPHPVMVKAIVDGDYDNVAEIRDVNTNDLMFVSDIMITDYSSTMFEFSLLRKPMAFFCYDYDDYDRDFYMDFDNELPGPLLRDQSELEDYLCMSEHPLLENYDRFYDKFMGACDGHSTERIVALIHNMYCGKDQ